MEHANKKKMLFDGERFADHYFVHGIQKYPTFIIYLILPPCSRTFCSPEVLTVLLQYGLFANAGYSHQTNIAKVLTGIIGIILIFNQDYSRLTTYALSVIEAGNILLRAVPCVKISSLLKEQKVENRQAYIPFLVHQLSQPHFLPKLETRCTDMQELQHLCRRIIRTSLYNKWQLPHGIKLLPLPKKLKEYINLQCD